MKKTKQQITLCLIASFSIIFTLYSNAAIALRQDEQVKPTSLVAIATCDHVKKTLSLEIARNPKNLDAKMVNKTIKAGIFRPNNLNVPGLNFDKCIIILAKDKNGKFGFRSLLISDGKIAVGGKDITVREYFKLIGVNYSPKSTS